jgi:ABC-type transport system substrate-binding protein
MNKKKTILLIFILVIPFITINKARITITKSKTSLNQVDNLTSYVYFTPNTDSFFSLLFKTVNIELYPDYANFLKQQLAEIGINVDIVIQDWGQFLDTILTNFDFDICTIGFSGSGREPFSLPISAYTENSSINLWGYDESMDWDEGLETGLNEWYIKQGRSMIPPNSQERIDLFWDWQQHLMDELLLLAPFFTPKIFSANWANLEGFNYTKGNVIHNWGHMFWDGFHTGQASTSEIVINDDNWTELNPFYYSDDTSSFIIDACLDELIYYDKDQSVWPHIAESWTFIDDTTVEVTIRDGIKWLDYGGFTGQYVDVDDVYFTIYCWDKISIRSGDWFWLDSLEKVDDMTLRIHIDGDPVTLEQELHAQAITDLNTWIVPEHWLNQTQEADGITPNITHASWTNYSTNCWGTGLFEIDSFTEAVETNLTVRSDCWMLDPVVDKSNMDFINRFGDFSGGLNQLRVRLLDDTPLVFTEFESGKLDLIDVTSDTDKRLQYNLDINFEIQSIYDYFFSFFGYNVRETRGTSLQSREPCPLLPSMTKGLAIRKAIAYAINRAEIDSALHTDSHYIVDYPIHSSLGIWCNEDIIKYDYNLTKAKEFMMYAGYDCGLDSDSDGLSDYIELNTTNTDRFNNDTDFDLMPDGWEVGNGLNPLIDDASIDFDLDGLTNLQEYQYNTDPQNTDTDSDGLLDGEEIVEGTNPLAPDTDEDGFTDKEEIDAGTDPLDPLDFPTTETSGLFYISIILISIFSILFIILKKRKK